MQIEPKRLFERYEKAKSKKDLMRGLYDDAFTLISPQNNPYNVSGTGSKKDQGVYTTIGITAANRFVNHMQASLTPPFKKWIELHAGEGIPEENANEVNKAWEGITNLYFEILNSSNFNAVIAEWYLNLAVGTAALLVLPGTSPEKPINFVNIPLDQITIEDGPYGNVGAVYRCQKIAGMNIEGTWEDAKLPAEVKRRISQNPSDEIDVIEISYENDGKYYYEVFLKDQTKIVERRKSYNPWIITRLGKLTGETFGRGPVIQALPDLQMRNQHALLSIKSAQLNTYGIYTVSDSDVINPNTLILSPGSFIPVSRNGGPNGPSIAPLPRAGDVNMQQLMSDQLESNIKSILLNDKLPPEVGPTKTATEISIRQRGNRIDTESMFGRLMYEFVQPLWQAIITILDEASVVNLPDPFKKIDNFNLKVKVVSPIAKEQAMEEIQALVNAAQITGQLGGPEMVQLAFKVEDIGEKIANEMGVFPSLIRTKEERDEMQQMHAQLQLAQQEQAMPQQGV